MEAKGILKEILQLMSFLNLWLWLLGLVRNLFSTGFRLLQDTYTRSFKMQIVSFTKICAGEERQRKNIAFFSQITFFISFSLFTYFKINA